MQPIEVIPSAKRLIKSLRDMGYDFSQAVADIVDNSIEAKATLVAIDVEYDGDDSWVRIADNGIGMKPEELREAMRYGSNREYNEDDLGKFGLGLKTASMSQCQCLSVASRWNPVRADVAAYSWDLDHIERTNRWEILQADKNALPLRKPLKDTTGTVVLWERLDRILGYKHPYGEFSRKRLSQMCRDIEIHLSMVFHKFLTGEARHKPLKILLNGNKISPWDPFCRAEAKTRPLQPVRIQVEQEEISGEVLFEPFVLPHQDDFSSPEAFRLASGPANWNQQQGFYVYRAGRMIQSGGWSHLRAPDEHTKLARVAVSFSPDLDEAFKINVAKMRAQMPGVIREDVRQLIAHVTKIAREVYDRKATKAPIPSPNPPINPVSPQRDQPASSPSTASGNQSLNQPPLHLLGPNPPIVGTAETSNGSGLGSDSLERRLTMRQWSEKLIAVAKFYERPVVEAVLKRLDSEHH